jgi:hypothetical protein
MAEATKPIDTVTVHRTAIAEIFAEADRRANAGEPNGTPAQFEGESDSAFHLRAADTFIHIACEHAAGGPWFPGITGLHAKQRSEAAEPVL